MDGDRKYKQSGYNESGNNNGNGNQQKPRQPQGPRPSIDTTGPRLPRLVQSVTASRCYSCATTLPAGIDFKGTCPKCNAALHCCKQCSNFESSTRFQCLKPILVRIVGKDIANDCEMFSERVTVARDVKQGAGSGLSYQANNLLDRGFHGQSNGNGNGGNYPRREQMPRGDEAPRNAQDARAAFDNLFKKP